MVKWLNDQLVKWYSSSRETHLRATERHLPYEITQYYLPPDTGKRAPPEPQQCRPVLDLPTPEGWKAEQCRNNGVGKVQGAPECKGPPSAKQKNNYSKM